VVDRTVALVDGWLEANRRKSKFAGAAAEKRPLVTV